MLVKTRKIIGLEIEVRALNTSRFLYIRATAGETLDLHLTTAFNMRLKSFLKCWFNPISVNFLCVQQVKHNEHGGPFWSCSERIYELEAVGHEPFPAVLLQCHTYSCEHMDDVCSRMLRWYNGTENQVLECICFF